MYCFASAAIHCGAPSGYSSHGCDARQRERASVRESVHPWTASVKTFKPRQICGKNEKSELSLLRQAAAQTGPRKARRRRVGKCPQGTAQDARSFAAVHGRTVSEPPERLCAPAGQEPGGRAFPGCAFFGYFLCTSKESNPLGRRPSGSLALRHQQESARLRWIPAFAGMTS